MCLVQAYKLSCFGHIKYVNVMQGHIQIFLIRGWGC